MINWVFSKGFDTKAKTVIMKHLKIKILNFNNLKIDILTIKK